MTQMKSRVERVVLACIGALLGSWAIATHAQSASFPARSSVKAVFVGHSLINHQMPQYLKRIAASKSVGLESAVQILNGTPLSANWAQCRRSQFTGQWPPRDFACDAIEAGTSSGPYDAIVVTDANNSIESNRIYNETHKYVDQFMNLLLSRNPSAKTYLYTSWEGWGYHRTGTWLDAIGSELAQYELIARQAQQLSLDRGIGGRVDVIPANVALRELVLQIQSGQIPHVGSRMEIFLDDVHMTPTGNYFMACVVFAALYNQSPVGAASTMLGEYGQTELVLQDATARALQSLAWQVVGNYRSGAVNRPKPRAPQNVTIN